jgi:hypothetical protein
VQFGRNHIDQLNRDVFWVRPAPREIVLKRQRDAASILSISVSDVDATFSTNCGTQSPVLRLPTDAELTASYPFGEVSAFDRQGEQVANLMLSALLCGRYRDTLRKETGVQCTPAHIDSHLLSRKDPPKLRPPEDHRRATEWAIWRILTPWEGKWLRGERGEVQDVSRLTL